MRIAVASGHYPPNFVSGGSLQPQRLARALQSRGHTVSVYAGRLDAARPPLSAWDETDDTGLPVRWIVTTPWDDWSDDRNWHCPDVEADFETYLARVAPDVVHLHDLQMLGGGLVPAAKRAGARVVVTMHDFWWTCGRLFLVDRSLRPCSLVVDAGVCGCEVNRPWLLRRNRQLAQWLQAADLVLAPSHSAVRVLEANGLAPDRLAVDENGLPDEDLRGIVPRAHERHHLVHFVYAGGRHHLKGVGVLLDAARALPDVPGWRMTLYGVSRRDLTPARYPDGLPVTLAPAFSPAERDDVFAEADIVVIPSIMRETYSILTREALARGVPVVCTNSLGPEEVIRHGENGLVVPAGDVEALADALRALVSDRERLAKLVEGCQRLVTIRSLHDQVDALEQHYRRLQAEPDEVPAPVVLDRQPRRRPVARVVWAVGIEGAPLRYRARLGAEALALAGVRSETYYYRDPALRRAVVDADVLYVYRVPATFQILELIDETRRRGVPVIFDVDDLIIDPDIADEIPALQILSAPEAAGWLQGVRRYRTTLEHCDGFVGSTAPLVRHAQRVTGLPAARFDNGVGLVLGQASERATGAPRTPGPVRIGYLSGTITHDRDWFHVEPAVVEVMSRHRSVELWLAGYLPATPALDAFAERVRRVPFTPWLRLPSLLHDIDVNLAPLEPGSRFNEAKSAIKWLEAALVATPSIASPTEPFAEAIDHGASGLLASDVEQWAEHMDLLVSDPLLRRSIGERARREALLRWSPHQQARRLLAVLDEARDWPAAARSRSANGWVSAIADEPWTATKLQPYPPSLAGAVRARARVPAENARWYAARVADSVQRRGVVPTAAAAARAGVRSSRSVTRSSIHVVRSSRAVELAGHTRRLLAEQGPATTVRRALPFAGKRVVALLGKMRRLPGIAHVIALIARLRHALAVHGPGGTVRLALPIVRHWVLHSITLARLNLGRLRRRLGAGRH